MPWIRWECSTRSHELIGQLAEELKVRRAEAVGLYVNTCCGFGEHRQDGDAATVTDATLEAWADWQGKPGKWAGAFRTLCLEDGGQVRGWWRQEALLRHQEQKRQRPGQGSRKAAAKQDQGPSEGRGEAAAGPAPARHRPSAGNEDVYGNGTKATLLAADEDRLGADPAAAAAGNLGARVRQELPEEYRAAFDGHLRASRNPEALVAELQAIASGMHPPGYPWPLIGRALHELAVAGVALTARSLRGFCRKLAEPDPPQRPSGPIGAAEPPESEFAAAARRLEEEERRKGVAGV
jgi:hypothetical protein